MANQGCKCKCLTCGAESVVGAELPGGGSMRGGLCCTCGGYFIEYQSRMKDVVSNLYNLGYRIIRAEVNLDITLVFAVKYPQECFPRLLTELGFTYEHAYGHIGYTSHAIRYDFNKYTPGMSELTEKERISKLYHWTVWLKENSRAGFEVLMANLQQEGD